MNYDEAEVARTLDGDLANNIGNLVSRIVKLAARRYARVVPPAGSGALNDVAHGGACRIRGALESFETARAEMKRIGMPSVGKGRGLATLAGGSCCGNPPRLVN